MNVFGTVCYAYVQEKKKLDPISEKGLFLGYDKYSPAYLVYFPETHKIKKVGRVVFTNEFLQVSEDVNQADYCDDDNYQTAIPREERAELSQGENIPESTRRYPVRKRTRPEYFYSVAGDELDDRDAVNVNVDFCYSVRDLPQSYTEAVHSPDSQNWRNAMDEEMTLLL